VRKLTVNFTLSAGNNCQVYTPELVDVDYGQLLTRYASEFSATLPEPLHRKPKFIPKDYDTG